MKANIQAGFLYIVIASAVMFSWFHYGLMYGGLDIGIPTYNPQRILEIIVKPWRSETVPGYPRPINISAIPVQLFFTLLQHFGLPPYMIQATTFGILLFLMGFGMFLLVKDILKGEKIGIAVLAGFFYIVNPFMMISVWHRFIYSAFFFAASLPFLLLFWKKWIREKDFTSLTLFLMVNFFFSYMFATLANVITLWLVLGLYTLFEIVVPWAGFKRAIRVSLTFSLGLLLWVLTNAWWIASVLFVLPALASAQQSVGNTISTLFAIGKYSIVSHALPGLNPFYLFRRRELGEVFSHPLFLFIPWLGVSYIMLGAYYARKNRELIFWSILFITAVFLAKGVAPPLGYIYPYIFEKFFFLGILRNPFEKFGILIPFAGSILFSLSFYNLAVYFWRRNILVGKAAIILSFGLFFGIYHWPFWSGMLFGTVDSKNFVEVPSYYQQANQWITDQKKDGNILHLPLPKGDSATYKWQYGYSGLDPNLDIFASNPSILTRFGLSYIDDALEGFDLIDEFDSSQHSENLKELFRSFNVRFIVLHNDINWQKSGVQQPDRIAKVLNSLPFLKKQKELGKLSIYEIDDKNFLGKIYTSANYENVISGKYYNPIAWFLRNSNATIISEEIYEKDSKDLPGRVGTIFFPQAFIKMEENAFINEEGATQELLTIKFLPDSPFYPLILLKEFMQKMAYQSPKENISVTHASKRLVEASKILNKNPNFSVSRIIRSYEGSLDAAVSKIIKDGEILNEPPDHLKKIFMRHKVILESIKNKVIGEDKTEVNKALISLREKMIQMNMQTIFDIVPEKVSDQQSKLMFRFMIPTDGEYEILMNDAQVAQLYENNLSNLDFQIDNSIQIRNSQIKNDLISFGIIQLKAGQHEIGFKMKNSLNLTTNEQFVEIASGKHTINTYNIKMTSFLPNSEYLLSLQYFTKEGSDPIIRTLQDSDSEDYLIADAFNNQRNYQLAKFLSADSYNKYWKDEKIHITPRKNSSSLSFEVVALPWDDCTKILVKKWLCDNPAIRRTFQRPSAISLRNINVYRILDNTIFLRTTSDANITENPKDIVYKRTAPLVYEGSINLDKPQFLIFSETYNNGWDLTLYDGGKEYKPSKHFFANIYGNGWFLDKNGNYKFVIRFSLEKYLYIGVYISIISFVVYLLFYMHKIYKKNHEKNN